MVGVISYLHVALFLWAYRNRQTFCSLACEWHQPQWRFFGPLVEMKETRVVMGDKVAILQTRYREKQWCSTDTVLRKLSFEPKSNMAYGWVGRQVEHSSQTVERDYFLRSPKISVLLALGIYAQRVDMEGFPK